LLVHAVPVDARDYLLAELDEVFERRCRLQGPRRASRWYWRQTLAFAARWSVERLRERTGTAQRVEFIRQHDRRGRMRGSFEAWTSDFTHAARRLMRMPGFTLVTVLTLGLAIGASTAIFSVVDAVLIDPLPYPDADRLVSIRASAPGTELKGTNSVGIEFFVAYRDHADRLESLGLFLTMQSTARTKEHVDRLFMAQVTPSVFETLGVQPVLGRFPTEEENRTKAPVMVISHRLWRDWFGGDPSVLGRSFEANNAQRTVVGVMGPDFRFPDAHTSIWLRAGVATDDSQIKPGGFNINLIARKKPGVTDEALTVQLTTVAKQLPDRFGGSAAYRKIIEHYRPVIRSFEEQVVGNVARPLWILLGTVGIVFLIACANVANLFIARAESRRRDLAVRRALGAGRSDLVRSLMAEALVLAALGGAAGTLFARLGTPLLVRAAPEGLPNLDLVSVNELSLLVAVGLSILAACLFGLLPAIRFSSIRALGDLRQAGRVGAAQGRLMRKALIVVQAGSAVVLLVGAGLLARSFVALSRVDLGFSTPNIFTFQVAPVGRDFNDGPSFARFHVGLMERLRAMPGIESVGVVNELPLDEGAADEEFATEVSLNAGAAPWELDYTHTGGDYFRTMDIGLVAGRLFGQVDETTGTANAIVSRLAAERLWPGEDPLGKRLRRGTKGDEDRWATVIGVVDDVRLAGFRQRTPNAMVYYPLVGPAPRSWTVGTPAYVVKTARADSIAPDIRAVLREYAPGVPMYRVFTMDGLAARATAQLSFTMLMLAIAAGLAVVLAAVGVYGVLSYVVSQRRRELAVRMALGAEAPALRRMVVMQGSSVTMLGVALGIAAALWLTGVLESLLFGVKALDPPTFAAMSLLMLAVSVLASYVPARRASAVDPVDALKGE
jgi:putative ABC transport system permease protein